MVLVLNTSDYRTYLRNIETYDTYATTLDITSCFNITAKWRHDRDVVLDLRLKKQSLFCFFCSALGLEN